MTLLILFPPLFFPSFSLSCVSVSAANWAQVSGLKGQNVASIPKTGWGPRFGHAIISFQVPGGDVQQSASISSKRNRIFILGGDDYNFERRMEQPENKGVGGLHNDVWSTPGPGCLVFSSFYYAILYF